MLENFLGAEAPVEKPQPKLKLDVDQKDYPDTFQTELNAHDFQLYAVLHDAHNPDLNSYNIHIYREDGGLYDAFVYVEHQPQLCVLHKRQSLKREEYTSVGPQIVCNEDGSLNLEEFDRMFKHVDIRRLEPRDGVIKIVS